MSSSAKVRPYPRIERANCAARYRQKRSKRSQPSQQNEQSGLRSANLDFGRMWKTLLNIKMCNEQIWRQLIEQHASISKQYPINLLLPDLRCYVRVSVIQTKFSMYQVTNTVDIEQNWVFSKERTSGCSEESKNCQCQSSVHRWSRRYFSFKPWHNFSRGDLQPLKESSWLEKRAMKILVGNHSYFPLHMQGFPVES